MPNVRLVDTQFYRLQMQTRFPFRYGIASMTEAPHLFVVATVEIDNKTCQGMSADGLPPKWFTKNAETTFEQDDLPSMLTSIRQATDTALSFPTPMSFFTWWWELYNQQHDWSDRNSIPPLLASFGVSLIERAVLDALCRHLAMPLFSLLQKNALDINLGVARPSLQAMQPKHVLPDHPSSHVKLRHTIGMGDAILKGEQHDERPSDTLPFSLEENIEAYGLTYFKIKVSGNPEADRVRLLSIAQLIQRRVGPAARFTLDGNENFVSIGAFREAWEDLRSDPLLADFFERSLLFVEQPIHRQNALDSSVGDELRRWQDAPSIIIDESDGSLSDLPQALTCGYAGTSHKNCKGVMKGLINAATLKTLGSNRFPPILSAEDLGNVGPVALLQDLAVVSTLGISHVERNGHHYFAGLSMFPHDMQSEMLEHHGDLYDRRFGITALASQRGELKLDSVNAAPLGLTPWIDARRFERWEF